MNDWVVLPPCILYTTAVVTENTALLKAILLSAEHFVNKTANRFSARRRSRPPTIGRESRGQADTNNSYVEQRQDGYWVAHTRVSLDSVVVAFLQGLSPETIATECFPALTLEQVYGAIAYCLGHRAEIDAYLQQADAEFAALRQSSHAQDQPFYEQLMQARRLPAERLCKFVSRQVRT